VDIVNFAHQLARAYRQLRDRFLTVEGKFLVAIGMIVGIFSMEVVGRQTYVFWSALFGVGLSSFLVTRLGRPNVTVDRKIPLRVIAGATVTYPVLVRSSSTRSESDLEVREEGLPFGIDPLLTDERGVPIRRLDPQEVGRASLTALFEQRGVFDLPAIRIERTCPLGLTRSGRTHPCRSRVIVHPRQYPVDRVDFSGARVYQPGGIPLSASVGESTEFVGLREYRTGDPLRHISWRAWARVGEPVVREFQGEYFRRVALVLDTRVRRGSSEDDHFETAVSVTASVAQYFETHEFIIDLFAAGSRLFYLQAGTGLGRMEDVLDLLACVEPSEEDTFPRVDDRLCELVNRLSGMVLVTTDWWHESRAFHARLLPEIPEIKVLLVRPDQPTLDPTQDIDDVRLFRKIDPGVVETAVLDL